VRQIGYLQELNRDARSTKHKKFKVLVQKRRRRDICREDSKGPGEQRIYTASDQVFKSVQQTLKSKHLFGYKVIN
jgi:hypothetical protein